MRQELDEGHLREAVGAVLAHHDALRLRLRRGGDGEWEQVNEGPGGEVSVGRVDLRGVGESEQGSAIEERATELQGSLDLAEGPLVRVAVFELGEGKADRLLIIIHHLVVDGVSWRILLEDLLTAYGQAASGQAIRLPAKTTSFRHWAERLREYAGSEEAKEELEYWLGLPWERVGRLPVDHAGGSNEEGQARTLSVGLSEEETRALLQEVPAAFRTEINEVLLTALGLALRELTGKSTVQFDLEGHGREDLFEDVDLSRTVGWFTAIYPVLVDLSNTSDQVEALRRVKEQLRRIPMNGLGWGALRYLSPDSDVRESLRALPRADLSFNYLGQVDQGLPDAGLFARARESIGPERSLRGERSHLVVINGGIADGRLELAWSYSSAVFEHGTVERVAQTFLGFLRSIIKRSASSDTTALTPSDFPLANLSQDKLDKVIAKVRR